MDLGGASAARAPDRLGPLPPFPPEAERCAFTAELSISTSAGGPPAAAKAWNTSAHTPLAAQRTKRLYKVLRGPYAAGASTQRHPERRTCTIPLITRRSSTRATPRVSVGRSGSNRRNCSSLSQKLLSAIAHPLYLGISESDSRPQGNPLYRSGA